MTLPALLRENEATDAAWKRRARDLVNLVARRTIDQGATMERPRAPDVGTQFYDTTIGKPVWWNGAGWADASGAAA